MQNFIKVQNFIKIKFLKIFAHNRDYNNVLYKRVFYDFFAYFYSYNFLIDAHFYILSLKITFYNYYLYIIVFNT